MGGTLTKIEEFMVRALQYDPIGKNRRFVATRDSTKWYLVDHATSTMYTPDTNVLRVNKLELSKFLAATEAFYKSDLKNPLFNWDKSTLNLSDYGGSYAKVLEGINLIKTQLLVKTGPVACDIESRYLEWEGNKLLAIGFTLDRNSCIALWHIPCELYPQLMEILNFPNVRYTWHNGKFDLRTLAYTCGIRARVDEDTELKHFSRVSETKGMQKLKVIAPLYLQAPHWDDELEVFKKEYCRKNKILLKNFTYDMIPISILIPYMQLDCIATYRLNEFFDTIAEPGTEWIYRQLCRASNVFVQVELSGAHVDLKHLELLRKELTADLEKAEEEIAAAVKKLWNPQQYAMDTGAKYSADFNMKSPKKLKWLLEKATGRSLSSTDKDTVKGLAIEVTNGQLQVDEVSKDLFKGIMASRRASKYLDTYVTGMLNVRCQDGRVRGTFNLHGTETGRLSSNGPNMQNIPRDKHIKNIFDAESGNILVQGDESQAELRVMAWLTGDPNLIADYQAGKDLHASMAERIFGPNFTDEDRSKAKTVNFGIPYGRGPSALVESKDFHVTQVQARQIINDWFAAVPVAKKWMDERRREARKGVRQQTLFGRVRHYVVTDNNLYHIENNYINTPIQSIASDLVLFALCDLYDWLVAEGYYIPWQPADSLVKLAITVHDSIVCESLDKESIYQDVAAKMKELMEEIPAKMLPNITFPFKSDIEIGYAWGKLKKCKQNLEGYFYAD